MNRGLAWFLALMAMVLVGSSVALWWIGWTLANLAFFDERSADPYTILDFARSPDAAVYRSRYSDPLGELVRSEGGEVRGQYRLNHVLVGRVEDEWPHLKILSFSSARDLVRVLTSSPYRLLRESFVGDVQKLGTFKAPLDAWRPVVVIWLLRQPEGISDPLAKLIAMGKQSGGRLVWDGETDAIERETAWNRIVALDFGDAKGAFEWLRAEAVTTETTLSQSRLDGLAVYVYEAQNRR